MSNRKLSKNFKLITSIVLVAIVGLVVVDLHGASLTSPASQPLNFIAAPDLSTYDVNSGNSVAFSPWFENGTWQGDLYAYTVDTNGNVGTATWNARAKFTAAEGASPETSNYWSNRIIITTNGNPGGAWGSNVPPSNSKLPFRYNDYTGNPSPAAGTVLTLAQQTAIGGQDKVEYVRGRRSKETQFTGGTLRQRYSILGDIIHSRPVYVGQPKAAYTFNNYQTFKAVARDARVYVGANDGMVHAFDATNTASDYGKEVFAYIPSMVVSNLGALSANPYVHTYFVDGELTTGDAYVDTGDGGGTRWHTILTGGLGAGGKGFFALDVTTPVPAGDTEANAKSKILWEIGTTSDVDLGYTFSRVTVARLKTGQWVAIAGNGYDSTDGKPVLYLIDIATGAVAKSYADTTAGSATDKNGLSSPTVVDVNGDNKADYVYAGDINGNMWRFDLTSVATNPLTTSAASTEVTSYKLYTGSASQPITAAPDVSSHPDGGYMVFFGTGRGFTSADIADTTTQSIYGIRDTGAAIVTPQLVTQTLANTTYPNPAATIRVCASKLPVDYAVKNGWKVNLPSGERLLSHMQIRASRAQFTSTNTTTAPYENWLTQLDYLTGCEPSGSVFDLNGSNSLTDADGVDYGSPLTLHYPVAKKLTTGVTPLQLASHPVIAFINSGLDTILINNEGVPQPTTQPPCTINCSGGFTGGHIDVDTDSPSGGIYKTSGFDGLGGKTDVHQHEYDKCAGQVYVDYFSLDPRRSPLKCKHDATKTATNHNRVTETYKKDTTTVTFGNTQKFLVLIANADLSPGGKLTIGSAAAVPVKDYQDALINKIQTATLTDADLHTLNELLATTLDGNNPIDSGVTIPGALRISFEDSAIQTGGLIGTNTGCVKDQVTITADRWRNGALTIQLLAVPSGLTVAQLNAHVAANTTIQADDLHSEKQLDGTTKNVGTTAVENTGVTLKRPANLNASTSAENTYFLYESTLFWHWNDEISTATATILALLADQNKTSSISPPCYGDTGWTQIAQAVAQGLTASQLAALDAEIARLEAISNPSKNESKRLATLKNARSTYVPPGTGGGGGGGVVVIPAVTEGGLRSGGHTTGSKIYTGSRSWVELGAD
jgi:hypothetical protein